MSKTLKVVAAVALAVIIGLLAFMGGIFTARYMGAGESASTIQRIIDAQDSTGGKVDYVEKLLREEALEPPKETSATAGAIQGLLEGSGDKYATYFDEEHFDFFSEDMAGEFGGIGVLLGEKDGHAYVVEVYKDTPADKAGVKTGDVFETIDGITRKKWTSDEVVKRVRGEVGTPVEITFIRPGSKGKPGKELEVKIVRDKIQYPNVEGKIKPGDVGYIRVGQFNDLATEDITKQIETLTEKGARSFVLDLRDNPGGALDQAVSVSSLFIEDGVVVRVDERDKPEQVLETRGGKITDAPLVVLINGNSASASEIVGGALQDYGRATLVGEKSFGKGSVQTVRELPFGGAIKFTIAHYLTPKKRVINDKGLTPDVVVKMDAEKQRDEKTDTQLKKALEVAQELQQ